MNLDDPLVRNDLGDVVAAVPVADCRLEFRHQRGTRDLWCVASGPLAVIAWPVLPADVLERVRRSPVAVDARFAKGARGRYAKWQQVAIDEDLVIALRARGDSLHLAYLFGDGSPFGGGAGGLPTARRASFLERLQMWLSGHRAPRVSYARHADEDVH